MWWNDLDWDLGSHREAPKYSAFPSTPYQISEFNILIRYVCSFSLGASSLLCYEQLWRGWSTSKHNRLVSYLLCWRRHVSATVGHLQVTKIYIEENYTEYDHTYFIMLTTTCFGHCGPSSVHKNVYRGKLYRVWSYLLYYADDDMFRPLWTIFRSQKCI